MDGFGFSDWANLPKNLLDSVSGRLLSSSNYLRFSAVCKSWFGVAKHNQSRHKRRSEPPMLLFFNAIKDAWSLYDVLDNKVLDLQLTLPNKRFCGSAYGWLVLAEEDFAVTLIKPFFKSKDREEGRENLVIRLPQLNPRSVGRERLTHVLKATITADPILNADECIVFVIYGQQYELAFIRPARDTTWTYLPTRDRDRPARGRIADVIQWEDEKIYALANLGNLLMFDITPESNLDVKSFECGFPPGSGGIRVYLVDSNGKDLLMVRRYCDWEYRFNKRLRYATEFKVYQFNFDKGLWVERETLGDDVALFIGENLSICVVASNFPGCKQNCIYYNHDFDHIRFEDPLNDFGVYDMEKKSISKPYSKHFITLLKMLDQRPIWFTPTFQL